MVDGATHVRWCNGCTGVVVVPFPSCDEYCFEEVIALGDELLPQFANFDLSNVIYLMYVDQ